MNLSAVKAAYQINVKKMGACKETNKLETDETSLECCDIMGTNCIVMSDAESTISIGKGETLTVVLHKIALYIKDLFNKVADLNKTKNYKGLVSQDTVAAPTVLGETTGLGLLPVYTRVSVGLYVATFTLPVLDVDTTHVTIESSDASLYACSAKVTSTTTVEIKSWSIPTYVLADTLLVKASLSITTKNV